MDFFVHRALTEAPWAQVLSILVGDERLKVCMNPRKGHDDIQGISDDCISHIARELRKVENDYKLKDKGSALRIYDKYYIEVTGN